MKTLIFIATAIIIQSVSVAQDTQGKVAYQLNFDNDPANNWVYLVWFTQKNYLYEIKKPGAESSQTFRDKKYNSIQDSLKDAAIIKKFNVANENIKQAWYGELGSSVVIYSSFDNEQNKYCVKDTSTFVDWQLLADTMTVCNIRCQKAIGKYKGMDYIAWFAPSIPVSVAPLQFRGLPGLLIKETNNTLHRSLEMIELEWPVKKPIVIAPCSGAPFVTKQEMANITNAQNAKFQALLEELQQQKKIQNQ
jgi:GLPGLI family protein